MMVIYNNLKENNRKLYREFSKMLLVFISKTLIKTNNKAVIEILEGVSQNLTVFLLAELCDFLTELENNRQKKLVTYTYCSIINDFHSLFQVDVLRLFTLKLIRHLEKFYRPSTSLSFFDTSITEDYAYEANNYNKLLNADVKVY